MELVKRADRPEDKRRIQDGCRTMRKRWLEVEDFARRKLHIIQKAVSAQLQLYREELKTKDEEEKKILARNEEDKRERIQLAREESTEGKVTPIDTFLEGDCPEEKSASPVRVEKRLCCIVRRCHLVQHRKQSTSTQIGNRAGPKKCSTCRIFKPAEQSARNRKIFVSTIEGTYRRHIYTSRWIILPNG